MAASVGEKAPEFTLPGTGGREYSLSSYLGQPVVLVFYPGDDSPVCTKQLNSYNNELSAFDNVGAQVLAVSAQDLNSHEDFAGKYGFKFPLLADTEKEVAGAYGVVGLLGMVRRSIFVLDAQGVVRYVHRSAVGLTFRPVDELVTALRSAL